MNEIKEILKKWYDPDGLSIFDFNSCSTELKKAIRERMLNYLSALTVCGEIKILNQDLTWEKIVDFALEKLFEGKELK